MGTRNLDNFVISEKKKKKKNPPLIYFLIVLFRFQLQINLNRDNPYKVKHKTGFMEVRIKVNNAKTCL